MVKIGRNDPCPCGSGKKYKKCCLEKGRSAERKSAAEEAIPWEEDTEDSMFREDVDDAIDRLLKEAESHMSSEEMALYDAFDEIEEHMDNDRMDEAGAKFLTATAGVQELPDDFYWNVGLVADETAHQVRRDNPDLAIEILRKAVTLDLVGVMERQQDIAEIMIGRGDSEGGFSLLHQVAEENPDDIWSWITLARNYSNVEDYEKAESHIQHAIELGKNQIQDQQAVERESLSRAVVIEDREDLVLRGVGKATRLKVANKVQESITSDAASGQKEVQVARAQREKNIIFYHYLKIHKLFSLKDEIP